jgi:hypothetical protein
MGTSMGIRGTGRAEPRAYTIYGRECGGRVLRPTWGSADKKGGTKPAEGVSGCTAQAMREGCAGLSAKAATEAAGA